MSKMKGRFENRARNEKKDIVQAGVLFLFLLPLFFQLSGSVFATKEFYYDSQGSLFLLPFPLASVFCFLGIVLLLHQKKKNFGVGFVFSIFVLIMLSAIVSIGGINKTEIDKFILLIQFVLPLFALVLGSIYLVPKSDYLGFEAVALYVLLIIIPLEIIATTLSAGAILTPNLYLFSLYQHLQYLPVVFVGLYFITVNSLYENNNLQYLILFLAPWMGVYIAASASLLAFFLAILASIVSFLCLNKKGKTWYVLLLISLLWMSFASYYPSVEKTELYKLKFSQELAKKEMSEREIKAIAERERFIKELSDENQLIAILPFNLKERFYYWNFYGKGIFKNPKVFLFGHKDRPDRIKYPSAHNYYLDLIYHFGIISLLPFIYLIVITIKNCWKVISAGTHTPSLAMLITLIGFFVFADNFLKVSFRQPYSGMVMFFIWGILLARLSTFQGDKKNRND